jgi:hypothetical protein
MVLGAGCTTAPIDMSAVDPLEAEALVQQASLRDAAADLSALVDDNGWSQSANPAEAARAVLGRLIGGSDGEEAEDSAVELYIQGHDAPFRAAIADIEMLSERTRALAVLAITVASADGRLPQAGLARDIAASESALGAVRRAEDFFGAVGEQSDLSEEERAAYANALSALRAAEVNLARGADALAERRWAARSGLFG